MGREKGRVEAWSLAGGAQPCWGLGVKRPEGAPAEPHARQEPMPHAPQTAERSRDSGHRHHPPPGGYAG